MFIFKGVCPLSSFKLKILMLFKNYFYTKIIYPFSQIFCIKELK